MSDIVSQLTRRGFKQIKPNRFQIGEWCEKGSWTTLRTIDGLPLTNGKQWIVVREEFDRYEDDEDNLTIFYGWAEAYILALDMRAKYVKKMISYANLTVNWQKMMAKTITKEGKTYFRYVSNIYRFLCADHFNLNPYKKDS